MTTKVPITPPPLPSSKETEEVEVLSQQSSSNLAKSVSFDPDKETKFCIIAGVKNNDDFLFEVKGTEQTLTNLLGVKDLIITRVEMEKQKLMGTGDHLTHQIGQLLLTLTQKMDQILALVKKPDNQL